MKFKKKKHLKYEFIVPFEPKNTVLDIQKGIFFQHRIRSEYLQFEIAGAEIVNDEFLNVITFFVILVV